MPAGVKLLVDWRGIQQGFTNILDLFPPCELGEPFYGYRAPAVKCSSKLASDRPGRIGVAPKVSGKQHSILERGCTTY